MKHCKNDSCLTTHDQAFIDEKEDGIDDFQGPYTEWDGKHGDANPDLVLARQAAVALKVAAVP
jgi:hypothetical protein